MSDHTFTIDADGRITGGPFTVTQSERPSVMFVNNRLVDGSPAPVRVHVSGVPGTRPVPANMTPIAPSLFIPRDGANFTVRAGRTFTTRIGTGPSRGDYLLSTDAPGPQGDQDKRKISVEGIIFSIGADGNFEHDGAGYDVTPGTPLTVTFENKGNNPVPVYIDRPGPQPPPGHPEVGALFRLGGDPPVTLTSEGTNARGEKVPAGIETLTVPSMGMGGKAEAVISTDAAQRLFTLSTTFPPCGPSTWINNGGGGGGHQ